jgi:hypothetical protein
MNRHLNNEGQECETGRVKERALEGEEKGGWEWPMHFVYSMNMEHWILSKSF